MKVVEFFRKKNIRYNTCMRYLSLLLFLCSCTTAAPQPPYVLSTTDMVHSLVGAIVHDTLPSKVLIRGGADPHSYQMVRGDGALLRDAALVFYSGLGLEQSATLAQQLNTLPQAVAITQQLPRQNLLHVGGVLDPHVWLDAALWGDCIPHIVAQLCAKFPQHAATFQARAAQLRTRVDRLHSALKEKAQKLPMEKRYFVTTHDAFRYFFRAYFLTQLEGRIASPEGLIPSGCYTPVKVQQLTQFIVQHRIPVIFSESNITPNILHKLREGARYYHHAVSLSSSPLAGDDMTQFINKDDPFDGYAKMLHANVALIVTSLICNQP